MKTVAHFEITLTCCIAPDGTPVSDLTSFAGNRNLRHIGASDHVVTDQPLVSIDMDKATGVEAARFLNAVVTDLEKSS